MAKPSINTQLKNENKELKDAMELLQKQVQQILNQGTQNNNQDINPNKMVTVFSLTDNELILSELGDGINVFKFAKFGDRQTIRFDSLNNVVINQRMWTEEGYFFIADTEVIRILGLEESYTKILTKEVMLNILNEDKMEHLFLSTTDAIRDTIVNQLAGRINKGEDLDLNKLAKLNKIYGKKKIEDIAEQIK